MYILVYIYICACIIFIHAAAIVHTYHSHTCICMCLTCIEQCFYCPCVTRFLCAQRMCSARLRTCAFVPFAGQLWHALACLLSCRWLCWWGARLVHACRRNVLSTPLRFPVTTDFGRGAGLLYWFLIHVAGCNGCTSMLLCLLLAFKVAHRPLAWGSSSSTGSIESHSPRFGPALW